MSVYDGFFEMLGEPIPGINTRAYEAPIDITDEVAEEDERLSEAARNEVGTYEDEETLEEDSEITEEVPEDDVEDSEVTAEEEPIEEEEPSEDIESEEVPEEPVEETPSKDAMVEYEKCKRVHKNTLQLLAIINLSKDSFEQKFSKVVSENGSKEYNRIMNAFNDLITVTNETLTTKFSDNTYYNLIKYYVSLTKVFDIITRMTENFVKMHNEEKSETKS